MQKHLGWIWLVGLCLWFPFLANAQDVTNGKAQYDSRCAVCHGSTGNGGAGPTLKSCFACSSQESLFDKIEKTMPPPGGSCSGSCATDTAAYILSAFNSSVTTTTSTTTTTTTQQPTTTFGPPTVTDTTLPPRQPNLPGPGWHLVSPGSVDLNTVFLSQSTVQSVWAWNGATWQVRYRETPQNNPFPPLDVMEANRGYWVRTTGAASIYGTTGKAMQSLSDYFIADAKGWYLMGNAVDIDVTSFFGSLGTTGTVWTWQNNNWAVYQKGDTGTRNQLNDEFGMSFGSLRQISAGQGFWINPERSASSQNTVECVSNETFFNRNIWGPTISSRCMGCHNPQGIAASRTPFYFLDSSQPNYLDYNLGKVIDLVKTKEQSGVSYLLLKPSNQIKHDGGEQIKKDSIEYQKFAEMVQRVKSPIVCNNDSVLPPAFDGLTQLSPVQTLRKATLSLAGRIATTTEETVVNAGGETALNTTLDNLLKEDAFYDRLKEIYNDLFLTDRYINYESGVNLLNNNDYPNRRWYTQIANTSLTNTLRIYTNYGVAREPLELIAYVVRNDKPFTEILTADYIMVNAYSARTYGITQGAFQDTDDYNTINYKAFYPAKIANIPHAGVLTSVMFLNRFPTTDTNRNRHRSRMIYLFFLATDILKMGERPIDTTLVKTHNPTSYNPACRGCHTFIDPIAGAMQNWNAQGRYNANPNWYPDMRPPGFSEEDSIPVEEYPRSTQWVAKKIAADSRFRLSAIYTIYKGLTGQEPLKPPTDLTDPNYSDKFLAYEAQSTLFKRIDEQFLASNYNLKTVIKGILQSPYFRGTNASDISGNKAVLLNDVGMARMLTPEQLNRKIEATTGYPWASMYGGSPYLLTTYGYLVLYGGIDSDSITQRITAPNGIMANVQQRMANEVACVNVPRDFSILDKSARTLFPYVEYATYEWSLASYNSTPNYAKSNLAPLSALYGQKFYSEGAMSKAARLTLGTTAYNNTSWTISQHVQYSATEPEVAGTTVSANVTAIKQNIQYLHKQLLGEELALDDPEITRTYQLFYDTWKEGKQGIANKTINDYLHWSCSVNYKFGSYTEYLPEENRIQYDRAYVIRAWRAVLTYLLTDYRFLYE